MALTKFKLDDLIELVDERNSEEIRNFYGVNINKEFMSTVADTSTLNEKIIKSSEKIVLCLAVCRLDGMNASEFLYIQKINQL